MPEIELSGGEYWLDPTETIEKCFPLRTERYVGLIKSRKGSKFFYASVLFLSDETGYSFDVPRWYYQGLRDAICDSMQQAEAAILSVDTSGVANNDA